MFFPLALSLERSYKAFGTITILKTEGEHSKNDTGAFLKAKFSTHPSLFFWLLHIGLAQHWICFFFFLCLFPKSSYSVSCFKTPSICWNLSTSHYFYGHFVLTPLFFFWHFTILVGKDVEVIFLAYEKLVLNISSWYTFVFQKFQL